MSLIRSALKLRNIIRPCVRNYSIYEPDYIDLMKPKYPQHSTVNFQIKGYDYPVLENFQKYMHSIADYMDLEVEDGFAIPPKKMKVQRFKPKSTVVESEYLLHVYERTVQISNLSAPVLPTYLRLIQAGLPEGVTLFVMEHNEELEDARYVPDRELLELRTQLEEMKSQKKK